MTNRERDEILAALKRLVAWSTPFIEHTPISAETLWREFPDAVKHAREVIAKHDGE